MQCESLALFYDLRVHTRNVRVGYLDLIFAKPPDARALAQIVAHPNIRTLND
jgi:hypothetical protein